MLEWRKDGVFLGAAAALWIAMALSPSAVAGARVDAFTGEFYLSSTGVELIGNI